MNINYQKMPRYTYDGDTYDIPNDKLEAFLIRYPGAEKVDGEDFSIDGKQVSEEEFNEYEKQQEAKEDSPITTDAVVEEEIASEADMELNLADSSLESISIDDPSFLDIRDSLPTVSPYGTATAEEIEDYEKQVELDNDARFDARMEEVLATVKDPKEYTAEEKVLNSFENMTTNIRKTFPQAALTKGVFFRKVFGDENIDTFVENFGKDTFWGDGIRMATGPIGDAAMYSITDAISDKGMKDALQDLEIMDASIKPTGEIIEGIKEGNIPEIIAGAINAPTSIVPSLFQMAAGGGTPTVLFSSIFADSYKEINDLKASNLGISTTQLINEGKDDTLTPLAFSVPMVALERFGLGKITNAAVKKLSADAMKRFAIFLGAGLGEGGTEVLQTMLEKAQGAYGEARNKQLYSNLAAAKGEAAYDASIRFKDAFFEQDTWEAGLQGMIGGFSLSAGSNKDVLKTIAALRAPVDSQNIERDLETLTELQQQKKRARSTAAKEGIQGKIDDLNTQVSSRIIQANSVFQKLTPTEISEVNNLNDLSLLQIKRVKALNQEYNDGKIKRKDYLTAVEGFKTSYLNAKNQINGIVNETEGRPDVTKKNKAISDANEINTEVVLNPKSTPAQIDKAKTELTEDNQGIINTIINNNFNPNLDTQLTKEEFSADVGFEVQALINSYGKNKEGKIAPFGAYLKENLPKRIPGIFDKQIETNEGGDIIAKVDVSKADQEIDAEVEIDDTVDNVKERVFLNESIPLPDNIKTDVKKAVEALYSKGKVPKIGTKEFTNFIDGAYKNALKPIMAKFIGNNTDASLETFLRDNFEEILKGIPQSIINKRFPAFKNPVLDKDGKQVREKTKQGNAVFNKKDLTPAEFIKYFLGRDVGGSTKGTRKDALAETLAVVYGNETSLDVLQDENIQKKFKEIESLKPKDAIQKIDEVIDYIDSKFGRKSGKLFVGPMGIISDLIVTALKVIKAGIKTAKNVSKFISDSLKPVEKAVSKEIGEEKGKAFTNDLAKELENAFKTDKESNAENILDNFIQKVAENFPEGPKKDQVLKDLKEIKKDPTSKPSQKLIENEDLRLAIEEGISETEYKNRNNQASKDWKQSIPILSKLFKIKDLEYRVPKELLSNKLNEKRTLDFFEDVVNFFPNISILKEKAPRLLASLKSTVASGKKLKKADGSRLNVAWFNTMNKGKGKIESWMSEAYQPTWGYDGFKKIAEEKINKLTDNGKKPLNSTKEKEYVEFIRNYLTNPSLRESVDENGIKNGYELTVDANREAIEFLYNNLGNYYFKAKDKKIALENINTFLQMQTNHADGILKGLVPVISVTTKPEADPNFKEKVKGKTKTHNEHMVELFNANQRFLKILAKGSKNLDSDVVSLVKSLNQSLISKKAQGEKDATGASVQTSTNQFLNTFLRKGFSDNQIMITDQQGQTVTDYLTEKYSPKILNDILSKIPTKDKSVDGLAVEERIENSREYTKKTYYNNSILPSDDNLKNKFTNQQVLDKMADVDNKNVAEELTFSKDANLGKGMNDIIQNKTGIASEKTYSKIKAEVVGASKGRFDFFIPPSAEDFTGLLYKTLGKGKLGDSQMAWYKAHLLNPYSRAMDNISRDRVALMNDFKALKEKLKLVPKNLKKKIPGENFTKEQAARVYIWDKQGMTIPGMANTDIKSLVDFVTSQPDLVVFANQLIDMQKGDQYAAPTDGWLAGNVTTDLIQGINTTTRSKYLEVWQTNANEIFTEANLNKLEAAYGKDYRVALENSLQRMQTGKNRSFGGDTLTGRVTDWLTNSVGAIMFFNTRSAVLQTISAINFINFGDNNIYAAGKAFANQPQYWKDFKTLFNSDFLIERRDGLKLNVNEADIADMAKKDGPKGVISELLRLGFLPTQIADSFAIASGGSTFYRNRIKALEKEGMSKKEAEVQAFQDFRETAEESQQSSRPDKISQQQAGPLGRVILAFANTPAQYARIIKKAALDLKNGRGDTKTNVSKILYYGVAQNLIFNALQQALFALAFGEEEEEDKDKEKRYINVANGMSDSILRGLGLGGAIFSVLKNTALRLNQESDKKSPKYQDVLVKEILQISPPISSKIGKLKAAGRSYSWNKKDMMTMGWSIDNPAYLAAGQVIAATTNIPLDRAFKKIDNIRNASNSDLEAWQRVASAAGWSKWELGIKNTPNKSPAGQSKIDLSKGNIKLNKGNINLKKGKINLNN